MVYTVQFMVKNSKKIFYKSCFLYLEQMLLIGKIVSDFEQPSRLTIMFDNQGLTVL